MPRKKQYDNFAGRFRAKYGISPKEYRQKIVGLSTTVEQNMCAKNWEGIEYSHVPSVAFNKYRKAFMRQDEGRFQTFLGEVESGEKKINASAIFPHDIYRSYKAKGDAKSIDLQWAALPNYIEENAERILPVCDVSGSMWGLPMDISVSLGLYISERNEGIFKDAFMTFNTHPKMEYLRGSVTERMRQLEGAEWGGSTNLQAVFELLLSRAVQHKVPVEHMPTQILIISDMEFNFACRGQTNLEAIRAKYIAAGYEIPKIVFWNVNGRQGNVPAAADEKDIALISGASPAIIKSVLAGEDFTPRGVMVQTLSADRYACVTV